jgi:hypothetical protein
MGFNWVFKGLKVTSLFLSVEVKNEWSYTTLSPVCLRDMHKDIAFF